jgi:hypothetical protein
VDDALIAGAIERDRRRGLIGQAREQVLRPSEISRTLLASRGSENDRTSRPNDVSIDLLCDREHRGETATVVADARAYHAIAIMPERELHVAREDRVEVRTHEHRPRVVQPGPHRDDVSRTIQAHVTQAEPAQSGGDPFAAVAFFTSRRGDLRNRDLRPHRRRITRRDPRVRRCERPVCPERSGVGEGRCGHE